MLYAFLSVIRHYSATSSAEPPRKRPHTRTDFDLGRLNCVFVLLTFEFTAHGTIRELDVERWFSWR